MDESDLALDWSQLTKKNFSIIQGKAEISNTNKSVVVCAQDKLKRVKKMLYAISQAYPFDEATKICKVLGGKIFLPRNKAELKDMVAVFEYNDTNIEWISQKCKGRHWIPIRKNVTYDPVKHDLSFEMFDFYSKENVSFLPWNRLEPNGRHLQQCVVHKNGVYHDVTCDIDACFVCDIDSIVKFTLRGIDFESSIDDGYIVHKHRFNGLPVFRGISRVQILYDKVSHDGKTCQNTGSLALYIGSVRLPVF